MLSFHGFTGLAGEFDILDDNTSTQGMPYEYRSIMHPTVCSFGKGRNKQTIVPLNIRGTCSDTGYPTVLDVLHINILYCEGNIYACNSVCLHFYYIHYIFAHNSFVDPTCLKQLLCGKNASPTLFLTLCTSKSGKGFRQPD